MVLNMFDDKKYTGILIIFILLACSNNFLLRAAENKKGLEILNTYRKVVAADPKDVVAKFNLGLALYQKGKYKEAVKILEKCLKTNLKDKQAHVQVDGQTNQLLGIIYYTYYQENKKAVLALKRSLKYKPRDPDTFYILGLAYLNMKKLSEAIESFEAALKNGKNDAEIHFYIGRVNYSLGKKDAAIINYKKALAMKPDYVEALEDMAMLYHEKQESVETFKLLKRLVKIAPLNFNANYLLGLYYYKKQEYAKMVKAYNKAIKVKPNIADAYYNLGMAYYYQTNYSQAIVSLQKTITLNPKDSEAYDLLGQVQTAAIEHYYNMGINYMAQEKYMEALQALENVLDIDSNYSAAKKSIQELKNKIKLELDYCLKKAEQLFARREFEKAYNAYEQALKYSPNSKIAKQGLKKTRLKLSTLLSSKLSKGASAEKLQDYKEAKKQYSQALRLDPEYKPAKIAIVKLKKKINEEIKSKVSLAQKQTNKNKLKLASETYKQSLQLAKIFKNITWERKIVDALSKVNAKRDLWIKQYLAAGKKAWEQGDKKMAKENFTKVLARDPRNNLANKYILEITGNQSKAKIDAEAIRQSYYQGVSYYVKGDIAAAIKAWEKVLELSPNHQDAKLNIQRAKAKLEAMRKLGHS